MIVVRFKNRFRLLKNCSACAFYLFDFSLCQYYIMYNHLVHVLKESTQDTQATPMERAHGAQGTSIRGL